MPVASISGSSCVNLIGVGTPRGLQGRLAAAIAVVVALWTLLEDRWTRHGRATSQSSALIYAESPFRAVASRHVTNAPLATGC